MTQSFEDDATDELGYYTFSLQDHVEIITNDFEEAIHDLETHEIEQLRVAIRSKIGDVLREVRRREADRPSPEPPEHNLRDRWWDR